MGSLAYKMAALATVGRPAIRNRYDAMAKAISDAGAHYSKTQARKLPDALRIEAASAAASECEGLLHPCEHKARAEPDLAAKSAFARMANYMHTRLIVLRIDRASA